MDYGACRNGTGLYADSLRYGANALNCFYPLHENSEISFFRFAFMPITIRVEYEDGEVLKEIDSPTTLEILISSVRNESSRILFKYINPYGDTTFNSLLVKDFIDDIRDLRQKSSFLGKDESELLNKLEELATLSLKEPHLYLKFYGD